MRNYLINELYNLMINDKNIILLTGDLGYGLFDNFINNLPNQFINCGIAQQNMMSMACGLSKQGFKVYIYSIANFPTFRCLQQIRNDINYHNCDVNIISVAGFTYGMLGYSHYALQDIAILRTMNNIKIYSPSDIYEASYSLQSTYNNNSPSYIRITNGNKNNDSTVLLNGSFRKIIDQNNSKLCLVTGGIISKVLNDIKRWKDCDIYSVYDLSNIDQLFLNTKIQKYSNIYTVQQHIVIGGLGSIIIENLMNNGYFIKLNKIGNNTIPNVVGTRQYMLQHFINWNQK